MKNLRYLQNLFGVRLVARENWVEIHGEEEAVQRVQNLLAELARFYELRSRQLETRDFEFLCRSFRDHREGDLHELWNERIAVSPKKREVLPRSRRQLEYVRQMRSRDMVFGIGPAGTGKTYLAMAMALQAFRAGDAERIILTRPAMEAGEKLGFLPGDLQSKIDPYLRPLYDALYQIMGAESYLHNAEKGLIEVAPLAYMRGRTLDNAYIILDEAQNTTPAQMKMFLTRIGFGSKAIITGDLTQKDLPGSMISGLDTAAKILSGIEEIGFCQLTSRDVVRHPLVQKIVDAYDKFEKREDFQRDRRQRYLHRRDRHDA